MGEISYSQRFDFEAYGEGWTLKHSWGIAFDGDTKHLVYNTSDIGCPTKGASEIAPRRIRAPIGKMHVLFPELLLPCVAGDALLPEFSCHMI